MSKKATISKKLAAERAPKSNGAGKTVSRDAESGRFVEKANDHMERAWEKIYDCSGETESSKK
ncbi:MAG TPA: hypothetical protein VGP08_02345 [Pyrinomonadaceae bacterium]|jgi:hypothetical protein|nr:hypothetical protein [Pyrinomonadaceae bacterium]